MKRHHLLLALAFLLLLAACREAAPQMDTDSTTGEPPQATAAATDQLSEQVRNESAPPFSFAESVREKVGEMGSDTSAGAELASTRITDDFESIAVEVPAAWNEVDGAGWEDEVGYLGASLIAAPSIDGFVETFDQPGMQIWASSLLGEGPIEELADFFDFSDVCTFDGRQVYTDPTHTGVYDLYTNCDGSGSVIIVLAMEPADRSYAALILGQLVTDAELSVMDRLVTTFAVVDTLPGSETGN